MDECIWKDNGYFGNDLNIAKINFPENALIYINQGLITTVK